MNDTSQNDFVDTYRDALNKAGFNPKNVLMSIPTKKFNKHSKVPYHIITQIIVNGIDKNCLDFILALLLVFYNSSLINRSMTEVWS